VTYVSGLLVRQSPSDAPGDGVFVDVYGVTHMLTIGRGTVLPAVGRLDRYVGVDAFFTWGSGDESVADVADRANHRLMFGPEFGSKATYVHIDGPGATEVVVAPDLLE